MKKIGFISICLAVIICGCYRETALPLSPVVGTQITLDNLELMPSGVEASGIIGDYSLYNNQIQIVLQGNTWNPNYNNYEPHSGGAIIDAATRTTGFSLEQISKNDDGVHLIRQGVNLNSKTVIGYESISVIQKNQEEASLVLTGSVYDLDHSLEDAGAIVSSTDRKVEGLEVQTTFYLPAGRETEGNTNSPVEFFKITTVLSNTSSQSQPVYTVHDSVLFPSQVYDAFVPYPKWGFEKPEIEQSVSTTGKAYPPYVLFQARQDNTNNFFFTPQLDGLFSANREIELNHERVMVGKFFSNTQGLEPGGQMTFIRELHLYVKDTSAQILYSNLINYLKESLPESSMYQDTGLFTFSPDLNNSPTGEFSIENIGSALQWFDGTAFQASSADISFPVWGTRRLSNNFIIEVPVGIYKLNAQGLQGELTIVSTFERAYTSEDGEEVLLTNALEVESEGVLAAGIIGSGIGHATVTVSGESEEGEKALYRFTAIPKEGTPFPILGPTPSSGAGNTLFPDKFRPLLALPKGSYDLLISHGPLYLVNTVEEIVDDSVHISEFGVETDRFTASEQTIHATVGKSIEFPDYFSADFGVSTAFHEFGLNNPVDTITFAEGEDLDVIFFIDSHQITNTLTFFQGKSTIIGRFLEEDGDVASKELKDYLVPAFAYSTRSVSTESYPWGKGTFAVLGMQDEERIDSPPLLQSDPASFYDQVRTSFPTSLIMLQTPRANLGTHMALFSAIANMLNIPDGQALDPQNPYFTAQSGSGSTTTWLDFDLLQVLDGNDYSGYLKTRADWFALLNAGIYKPITGGSMIGSTANLSVGAVRTFVAVSSQEHRDNDLVEFWENVKAGRMFVTNGPLIEAEVNGSSFGQTTNGSAQTVLSLKVQAAPWIPITSIRVYVDGSLFKTLQPTGNDVLRFDSEVLLDLSGGKHWVVIEAGTQLETHVMGTPAGTFSKVYKDHTPFAVTNPVFIDVAN